MAVNPHGHQFAVVTSAAHQSGFKSVLPENAAYLVDSNPDILQFCREQYLRNANVIILDEAGMPHREVSQRDMISFGQEVLESDKSCQIIFIYAQDRNRGDEFFSYLEQAGIYDVVSVADKRNLDDVINEMIEQPATAQSACEERLAASAKSNKGGFLSGLLNGRGKKKKRSDDQTASGLSSDLNPNSTAIGPKPLTSQKSETALVRESLQNSGKLPTLTNIIPEHNNDAAQTDKTLVMEPINLNSSPTEEPEAPKSTLNKEEFDELLRQSGILEQVNKIVDEKVDSALVVDPKKELAAIVSSNDVEEDHSDIEAELQNTFGANNNDFKELEKELEPEKPSDAKLAEDESAVSSDPLFTDADSEQSVVQQSGPDNSDCAPVKTSAELGIMPAEYQNILAAAINKVAAEANDRISKMQCEYEQKLAIAGRGGRAQRRVAICSLIPAMTSETALEANKYVRAFSPDLKVCLVEHNEEYYRYLKPLGATQPSVENIYPDIAIHDFACDFAEASKFSADVTLLVLSPTPWDIDLEKTLWDEFSEDYKENSGKLYLCSPVKSELQEKIGKEITGNKTPVLSAPNAYFHSFTEAQPASDLSIALDEMLYGLADEIERFYRRPSLPKKAATQPQSSK